MYIHILYIHCVSTFYMCMCVYILCIYILSFEVYIYIKFFPFLIFLCKNSFSIAKLYNISILECLRIILIVSHFPPRFLWQGFFVCSPGDFSRFDKSVCDSYSLEIGFLCLQLLLSWNSWWLLSTAKYKSTKNISLGMTVSWKVNLEYRRHFRVQDWIQDRPVVGL